MNKRAKYAAYSAFHTLAGRACQPVLLFPFRSFHFAHAGHERGLKAALSVGAEIRGRALGGFASPRRAASGP